MENKIILFIIYLEGDNGRAPEQEQYLFEDNSSRKIWEKVFNKLGFVDFDFILLPKQTDDKKIKKNFDNIEARYSSMFQKYDYSKFEITFRVIITGDHDEKKEFILKRRKDFAKKIKNRFKIPDEIPDDNIVLKRDKKFNIESFMGAIVNETITKKILKEKRKEKKCKKYLTLPELFSLINIKGEKEIAMKIVEAIRDKNQENLILKKINELSPKKE